MALHLKAAVHIANVLLFIVLRKKQWIGTNGMLQSGRRICRSSTTLATVKCAINAAFVLTGRCRAISCLRRQFHVRRLTQSTEDAVTQWTIRKGRTIGCQRVSLIEILMKKLKWSVFISTRQSIQLTCARFLSAEPNGRRSRPSQKSSQQSRTMSAVPCVIICNELLCDSRKTTDKQWGNGTFTFDASLNWRANRMSRLTTSGC